VIKPLSLAEANSHCRLEFIQLLSKWFSPAKKAALAVKSPSNTPSSYRK
jgi:hypothetical protein